jgi:hypothetical protein
VCRGAPAHGTGGALYLLWPYLLGGYRSRRALYLLWLYLLGGYRSRRGALLTMALLTMALLAMAIGLGAPLTEALPPCTMKLLEQAGRSTYYGVPYYGSTYAKPIGAGGALRPARRGGAHRRGNPPMP